MELKVKIPAANETIKLVVISDVHYGSVACDTALFHKILKYIQDNDCYWLSLGDTWEGILPGDPRFDLTAYDFGEFKTEEEQVENSAFIFLDKMITAFAPIKDTCCGLALGNHEFAAGGGVLRGLTKELTKRLNVPFLGWTFQIKFLFTRKDGKEKRTYILMGEHGYSAPRTIGYLPNLMQRRLGDSTVVDALITGHAHQAFAIALPDPGIDPAPNESTKYLSRTRHIIACPSMCDSYKLGKILYAERKSYRPTVKGAYLLKFDVWNGKRVKLTAELLE